MPLTPEQQTELQGLLQQRQQREAPPEELLQAREFERRRRELQPFLEKRRGYRQADPPPVQEAQTLWQSLEAGWDQSTGGLILQGESPDMVLANDAPRAHRLASMAATVAGDLPSLVVGAIGGGVAGTAAGGPVGGTIGGGAGAFAMTEGVRTWLLEQYAAGDTKRSAVERLTASLWAAGKGAVVGGATTGVGGAVAKGVAGASTATRFVAPTSAEVVTMVGVAHALEGEVPNPEDFLDAAIVLGGLKGSMAVAGKLRHIYARTGKKPDEVVNDAAKDSRTWQELVDDRFGEIPLQYQPMSHSPMRPDPRLSVEKIETPVVESLLNPMKPLLPKERAPHHLNLEIFDLAEGPKRLADQLAKNYELEMQTAQRGRVPWRQSDAEAMTFLRELLGEEGLKSVYAPDTPRYTAEIRARKEVVSTLLNDAWERAAAIKAKGKDVTQLEMMEFLAAIDRTRRAQEVYVGQKAEIGRALQVMKNTKRIKDAEKREAEIAEALKEFGGKSAVDNLIKLTTEIRDPVALGKALRQPTVFEMITEGWKALLLSGPTTQQVNFLGNLGFATTRVPKEMLAATFGKVKRGSEDYVSYSDALSLALGMSKGAFDAVRMAGQTVRLNIEESGFAKGLADSYKAIEVTRQGKQEVQGKIPGVFGEVIRAPFKALTLGDIFARTMNSQASLYSMASKQALQEGMKPMSNAYWRRVNEIVKDPSAEMRAQAEADALRYVFLEEGPIIKALEKLRSDLPALQFVIPFLKAPGGIFREFFRHSPLAPVVRQWRQDFKAGGAKRDRALAEVAMGTAVAMPLFMLAREGTITGGGHPDRKVRHAQLQAGFQPYSIQLKDGSYLSYNRYEPQGTLMGLTADLAQAWELLDSGEQDDAAAALMWASTEVVKNKTWLKSVTSLLNAVTDPERYGESFLESFVGSFVPNLIGQHAREMDPYVREIDGILASVQSKLPGWRQELPALKDDFGEPVTRADPAWKFSPSTIRQRTTDKVRQEAARLGVSTTGAPDTLRAGSILGEAANIELTQAQRDVFATESGQLAYQILSRSVNSPGWERMHPLVQRRFYERAFAAARRRGAVMALPPEQRLGAIQALRDEYGL